MAEDVKFSDDAYGAATGLERALIDADREAFGALPARLITENLDPAKVKAGTNMNVLAYGLGVTLWEDRWSEGVKRSWLSTQWDWKSKVGTLPAIDMALAASGYEITDEYRPPSGFYASPSLTKEQTEEWVRLMPQIRIKYAQRTRIADSSCWFADDCFADNDDDTAGPDLGREIEGRQAVLRYADGTEVDLRIVDRTISTETVDFVSAEEVAVPFEALDAFCAGDFADDGLAMADNAAGYVFTIKRDHSYERMNVTSALSAIEVGLQPLTPFYEQDSDIIYDDVDPCTMFADDGAVEVDFCCPDRGGELLADRIYINDPDVAAPMTAGLSFANLDRVSIPETYYELMIDTHSTLPPDAFSTEDGFADVSFAVPQDDRDVEQAMRAVAAGKALRDTVHVSFEPRRLITFGDNVTEQSTAVDWVDNHL